MSITQAEAEATVRRVEGYGFAAPLIAWWRENVQPAVPDIPDGYELVEDNDGVPVFRLVTEADYGWLKPNGGIVLVGYYALPQPTDPFAGKRYIVHQVAPPVPTDVERLAQALAESTGMMWGGLPASEGERYVRAAAQNLYDLGVRCPEQTP